MLAKSYLLEPIWLSVQPIVTEQEQEQFYNLYEMLLSLALFCGVKAAYVGRPIKLQMGIDFFLGALAADAVSRLFGVWWLTYEDFLFIFGVLASFVVVGKQRRVLRILLYKWRKVFSLYYNDFRAMIKTIHNDVNG
jgi:hypothetical protein